LHRFVEEMAHMRPQRDRTLTDRRIACANLIEAHVVAAPRDAFAQAIEQHRLTSIDRVCEPRVRCPSIFELVPQRTEFSRLVFGK